MARLSLARPLGVLLPLVLLCLMHTSRGASDVDTALEPNARSLQQLAGCDLSLGPWTANSRGKFNIVATLRCGLLNGVLPTVCLKASGTGFEFLEVCKPTVLIDLSPTGTFLITDVPPATTVTFTGRSAILLLLTDRSEVISTSPGAPRPTPTGGAFIAATLNHDNPNIFRGFDGRRVVYSGGVGTATLLASTREAFSLQAIFARDIVLSNTLVVRGAVFRLGATTIRINLGAPTASDPFAIRQLTASVNGKLVPRTVTLPSGLRVTRIPATVGTTGRVVIDTGVTRVVLTQRWLSSVLASSTFLECSLELKKRLRLPVNGILATSYTNSLTL